MKKMLAGLGLLLALPVWAEPVRYALIIGIGHYAKADVPALEGVEQDMISAAELAQRMKIPPANRIWLRDQAASSAAIRQAFADLQSRFQPGDQLFVYYSGHGTRRFSAGGVQDCAESLLAADGEAVTARDFGRLLAPLAQRSARTLALVDACFAGGVAQAPMKLRSAQTLTPKFYGLDQNDQCTMPANFRLRSGSANWPQAQWGSHTVLIGASRADEAAFDNPNWGGLATSAWLACQQTALAGSSVAQVAACAQTRIDTRLARRNGVTGQHLTLTGNGDLPVAP